MTALRIRATGHHLGLAVTCAAYLLAAALIATIGDQVIALVASAAVQEAGLLVWLLLAALYALVSLILPARGGAR